MTTMVKRKMHKHKLKVREEIIRKKKEED